MAEGKAQIDFAGGQKSSDDPLAGAIPQSINVLVDKAGAIHVRPGISSWSGFDEPPLYDADTTVDGITVWNDTPVWVTSDRYIHAIVGGVGVDLSTSTATTQLDNNKRPVFARARTRLIITGGGAMQKWEGVGSPTTARLGGSAPNAVHVVANSQRLVVNPPDLSGQIQWSDPGEPAGHETWNGEFAELESRPDPLPALYEIGGELIGGGTETVQTVAPDPVTIYAPQSEWSTGIGAPYSFIANDETFGFLDSKRRIQMSDGARFEDISLGIAKDLQALPKVSDCWGFRIQHAGYNLLGWNFPSAARCFVWDLDRKAWSEFRGYASGQWAAWAPTSMFHWSKTIGSEENLHLVGLADGTIGKLDSSVVSDSGQQIVAEVYSGFSDEGTDNWKQHISTRLMFRRGLGTVGAQLPRCQLFWRDTPGAWEEPIELDFGDPTDTNPVVEVRSLGTYRTRQWRLRMSDNVPLTLVGAVTTYDSLEV